MRLQDVSPIRSSASPWRVGLLVGCAAVAGARDAHAQEAAPRTLFGKPVAAAPELEADEEVARKRAFQSMLEERGLEVHGDMVGPPSLFAAPTPSPLPAGEWEHPPHRSTIFLNFFGGTMSSGTNAALMESLCIPTSNFKYPGFAGTEAQALAIIETFVTLLEPYGIRVVYEEAPPPELPYAMVMMGGRPQDVGMEAGVLGVSCSGDCGDRWWRDATLAFTAAASPNQTNTLSTTALHEAAHAFGLAHIDEGFGSPYIMHPYVDETERVWEAECVEYNAATGGINCQSTHDVWCGGGAQNSQAELMAYFGANGPDTVAPTVEILTPADGLELEVGANIEIQAEVGDDHDGVGWKFQVYKDDELVQDTPAFKFEKTWGFSKLPAGVYKFRVSAVDHDRNTAEDEVTVFVGTAAPPGGTDTGDATTNPGSSDSGDEAPDVPTDPEPTSAGSDADSTGVVSTTGQDGEDGCSCRTDASPAPVLALFGVAAFVRRRRRRGDR